MIIPVDSILFKTVSQFVLRRYPKDSKEELNKKINFEYKKQGGKYKNITSLKSSGDWFQDGFFYKT